MSLQEIVVEGTLKADGALELDHKPNLPPGRVTVVLQQEAAVQSPRPLDDAFFQTMAEIRAGQRARGHVPRRVEEVEAERKKLRREMEEEIEAAIRLQEECRRRRTQAESERRTSFNRSTQSI